VPFLVAVAVRFSHAGQRGRDTGAILIQSVRANGLYLTLVALMVLSAFFLPLFASMAGATRSPGKLRKARCGRL